MRLCKAACPLWNQGHSLLPNLSPLRVALTTTRERNVSLVPLSTLNPSVSLYKRVSLIKSRICRIPPRGQKKKKKRERGRGPGSQFPHPTAGALILVKKVRHCPHHRWTSWDCLWVTNVFLVLFSVSIISTISPGHYVYNTTVQVMLPQSLAIDRSVERLV